MFNWEDTVMAKEQIRANWIRTEHEDGFPNAEPDSDEDYLHEKATALEQAEITWDIAFKAGIQEVVEYIQPKLNKISELVGNIRGDWTDPRHDCREIWTILAEIAAKLKDWEVEK